MPSVRLIFAYCTVLFFVLYFLLSGVTQQAKEALVSMAGKSERTTYVMSFSNNPTYSKGFQTSAIMEKPGLCLLKSSL